VELFLWLYTGINFNHPENYFRLKHKHLVSISIVVGTKNLEMCCSFNSSRSLWAVWSMSTIEFYNISQFIASDLCYLQFHKFLHTALSTALRKSHRYLPPYKTDVAKLYPGFYFCRPYKYLVYIISRKVLLSIEIQTNHKHHYTTSHNISINYLSSFL